MCEELKNLESPGTRDGIIYFMTNIIGAKSLRSDDVKRLCARSPSAFRLAAPAIVNYCAAFDWIEKIDEKVKLREMFLTYLSRPEELNKLLVENTLKVLFDKGIMHPDMFSFDVMRNQLRFHDERLQLSYATIRDVLVSQGFFEIAREPERTFFVNTIFERIVVRHKKKLQRKVSLEQLQRKLEENAIAGEKAEAFVLQYEQRRLPTPHSEQVKIISHFDTTAGYDIVSFESKESTGFDRFIEVKAITQDIGFYWSRNEYDVAKLKGNQYYLYLVDLSQIENEAYSPIIIKNPAKEVMESADWFIEAESFHVKPI